MSDLYDPLFGPKPAGHQVTAAPDLSPVNSPISKKPMTPVYVGSSKGPRIPAMVDLENRVVVPVESK